MIDLDWNLDLDLDLARAEAVRAEQFGGDIVKESADRRVSPRIFTNTGANATKPQTPPRKHRTPHRKTDPPLLKRADCICMYPK